MADTAADMTKEELRDMLESLIEQKLLELLSDPDERLETEKPLCERLISQRKRVASGEGGQAMEDLARELDLG